MIVVPPASPMVDSTTVELTTLGTTEIMPVRSLVMALPMASMPDVVSPAIEPDKLIVSREPAIQSPVIGEPVPPSPMLRVFPPVAMAEDEEEAGGEMESDEEDSSESEGGENEEFSADEADEQEEGFNDGLDDDDDLDDFDDIDEDDFDDDFDDDFEEELEDDYEIEIDDEISAEFGLNTATKEEEVIEDDLDEFDDFENVD